MIARTLIGTIVLLTMAGAHAGMYKWTDEQGNPQFGQFPPAGVNAEPVKPPPAPATPSDSTGSTPQERARALQEQQSSDSEKALIEQQAQENADRIRKNCENTRNNLKMLQRGGNHLYEMPDGSYKRFNAEENAEKIKDANKYIDENCS